MGKEPRLYENCRGGRDCRFSAKKRREKNEELLILEGSNCAFMQAVWLPAGELSGAMADPSEYDKVSTRQTFATEKTGSPDLAPEKSPKFSAWT
jgi:hypothetical protein